MLAPDAPARVVAVFDWEMATIGDPLAHLGTLHLLGEPQRPAARITELHAGHPRGGLPPPRGARRPLRGAIGGAR